jgi:hypothetical protein
MEIKDFKKVIGKSNTKNIIVGSGIFLFGIFIVWLILSGADSEMDDMGVGGMVVLWILAGLCLLFGGVLIINPIRSFMQVKSGKHPVVHAIESGNKGFIVWIYENITQVQGGGSDHQIWAFTEDGKKLILSIKGKRVQEVINYLSQQFPNAVVGWTEDIEEQMQQYFKNK